MENRPIISKIDYCNNMFDIYEQKITELQSRIEALEAENLEFKTLLLNNQQQLKELTELVKK